MGKYCLQSCSWLGDGEPEAWPRPCRSTPRSCCLEEAPCRGGWFRRPCLSTHSLEQAKDEGIEAHGMTSELWKLADFVVEAMQDLSRWTWKTGLEVTWPISGPLNSVWCPSVTTQHSPSCVDASTTLHGMFLRCPMITSSTKALSPSSSTAWTAGHKYFRTRWPTLGLTELFPSFACRYSREVQEVMRSLILVLS